MAINKDSFIPLYHQLSEEIKSQIKKGKLIPGSPVPSESKLISKYKLSRGTVRQAMQKLENDKLIERFPGRGTFVSEPIVEKAEEPKSIIKPAKIQSIFTQISDSTSKSSSISILESGKQEADTKVQNLLKLSEGENIFLLEKMLSLDSEPWCIEKSYFTENISNEFDKIDLLNSIYEQYEKITHKKLIITKYIIESIAADDHFSQYFKIEPGSPLFQIIRLSYLEDNTAFELSFDTYRADRVRFNAAVTYNTDEIKFNVKALKQFR